MRTEQGNTAFNATYDDGVRPSEMGYDVLDRNTRTELPDRSVTTQSYGFGRDRADEIQFQTTVTDANGKVKHSYRNLRQLITAVQESNASAPDQKVLWTSYGYDPLRQITQVIDAKGNKTSVEYDQLGRRTAITNPDTGRVCLRPRQRQPRPAPRLGKERQPRPGQQRQSQLPLPQRGRGQG